MDFGAREILILLGILVILAILLDGVRRVNRSRRGKLRTSARRASKNAIFDDDDDDFYSTELPGRKARVVEVRDEKSAAQVSEKIRRECDYERNKLTAAFRSKSESEPAKQPIDRDPAIFDVPESAIHDDQRAPGDPRDDRDDAHDHHDVAAPEPIRASSHEQSYRRPEPAAFSAEPERIEPQLAAPVERRPEPPRRSSSARVAAEEDILILHLMAHKGRQFDGEKLLEQLLEHGLRYGSMKIFHRHENKDGSGPVHFSVANSVNPGAFDLNIMDQFKTPGVTFIMPLDGLDRPLESFETLITTAIAMARKLGGELKDETRSALTKQTIEHYRQRIIDFTRRSFTLTN
ncbi:MAG: cell division protein ZipA [Porticoccaceae bacterium]